MLGALALSGCVSQSILIGEKPSDPPPQIFFIGARDADRVQYLTWENVPSFGRVPAELQAVGDMSCMRNSLALRATGYHPKARGTDGNPIPGGDFYCQLVPLESVTNTQPPRAILTNGVLGWDRPSAFRPIPEAKQLQAEQECKKNNPKAKPLAFHPNPIDVSGNTLSDGGYLCVE